MSPESGIQYENRSPKETHHSVRVFPYGPRTSAELLKDIQALKPDQELSLFNVYLSQKNNTDEAADGLIIPFGGRINDDTKDINKAGLRHLHDKSTLTVVPYDNPKAEKYFFDYKLNQNPNEPNIRVNLKSVFVLSPDMLQFTYPQSAENSEDVDFKIVPMRLPDFKESTKTGFYGSHMLAGVANYSKKK